MTRTMDPPAGDLQYPNGHAFESRTVVIGFGSVASGLMHFLFKDLHLSKNQVTIISKDFTEYSHVLQKYPDVRQREETVTEENYRALLDQECNEGDFLINLAVCVGSLELILYCRDKGILYLDTCVDPFWDPWLSPPDNVAECSNYWTRKSVLHQKGGKGQPTAILAHGANPGLVQHFVKKALLDMAKHLGVLNPGSTRCLVPQSSREWAQLAQAVGLKVIHIAERDTQKWSNGCRRPGQFVNTWSALGFVEEALLPAEVGWGSHEKELPSWGRHHDPPGPAIYIEKPACMTQVYSWTPLSGPQVARLITHHESIEIADYLTLKSSDGQLVYRPTVLYAYRPCDDAELSLQDLMGRGLELPESQYVLKCEDIAPGGVDQLGVLLMGTKGSYWYGSTLSNDEAARLSEDNNATGLQVTCSIMAAMKWAIRHPREGVVEASDIEDYESILRTAAPYLGKLHGEWTTWSPLETRGKQAKVFPSMKAPDEEDPWQMANFLV